MFVIPYTLEGNGIETYFSHNIILICSQAHTTALGWIKLCFNYAPLNFMYLIYAVVFSHCSFTYMCPLYPHNPEVLLNELHLTFWTLENSQIAWTLEVVMVPLFFMSSILRFITGTRVHIFSCCFLGLIWL